MELNKIKTVEREKKYIVIKRFIMDYIHSKKLKAGDKLFSENEIADMFNVTKVTASRALNELVSEGILYRIQGKGSFLAGYHNQNNYGILLFFPIASSFDPYFSGPLIETFLHTADEHGLNISLTYFKNNTEIEKINDIRGVKVIIVVALNKNEGFSKQLLYSINIPIIYLGSHPDLPVSYISFDNKGGARQAVEYFIKTGHKKIAFVSASEENISNEERKQGYLETLEKYNIKENLIFYGDYSEEAGYKIGKEIAKMRNRPDALLCANDLIAIGIMHAFFEKGISIPEDISIIGFGDYKISKFISPALSTVRLPVREMGLKLCKLTLKKIEEGNFIKDRIILPTELIKKESVKIRKKIKE